MCFDACVKVSSVIINIKTIKIQEQNCKNFVKKKNFVRSNNA